MAWHNPTGGPDTLKHGYTLADLHRVARLATHTDRSHHAGDYLDRVGIAWHGAVEHLYAAENPPPEHALVRAGRDALRKSLQADLHFRAISHHTYEPMPSAYKFWALAKVTPAPQDTVIDRVALWQIWPRLRETDRTALLALAAHEDYSQAAGALGMRYYTFTKAVRAARLRFLALWHEGEEPSKLWGRDRRAGRRGERATGQVAAVRQVGRRRTAKARAKASADAA